MKIHLIEDDPILAKGLQINLDLDNYLTTVSASITEALEQHKQNSFNFIILDLGLPDGSGFDLLQEIRKENRQIPIIILSAQSDEDSIVKGLHLGANDFVKKPYSYKELRARIQAALRVTPKESTNNDIHQFAGISVYFSNRTIKFKDRTILLNRREFDILSYLLKRPAFSRNFSKIIVVP